MFSELTDEQLIFAFILIFINFAIGMHLLECINELKKDLLKELNKNINNLKIEIDDIRYELKSEIEDVKNK